MDFTFDYNYVEQLTQINGISGQEQAVAQYMYDELKGYCDEVLFDNLGSIIFVKKGKENGPKVMIAAHMDQIGFMICDINDKGFCYVKPVGGWWPTQLMTQEVIVTTEDGKEYVGIIGNKPSKTLVDKKKIDWEDIYIDFGVKDKEELEAVGIQIGDTVTPLSRYKNMVNPKYVATKAWDNRVGCAIIGELLRNLQGEELPCTLYLVGTVQEEIGLRGAKTAAQMINPDICISTDIGGCGDVPGSSSYDCTLTLGEGPSIAIQDATAMGSKALIKLARTVAKDHEIPYQTDIMLNGGTDTGEMHKAHNGAVPLTVSIPTRYGHSHNSIIHLDDLENSVKLFYYLTKQLDDCTLKQLTTWVK